MEGIIRPDSKWYFRKVDTGHQCPFGHPVLMGFATSSEQIDLDGAMVKRKATFGVHLMTTTRQRPARICSLHIHYSKTNLALHFKALDDMVTHVHANSWWQH